MSETKRSIRYARMQGPIFIPNGPGQFGPELTVSTVGQKRISKMTLEDYFLILEMTVDGKVTEVAIPNAMVSHAVVDRTLKSV